MITDLFFFIINTIIKSVAAVFTLLNILVPPQIQTAFTDAFQYLTYLQNVFPIDQLLLGASFLVTLIIARMYLKIILMALNAIPFVNFRLPTFNKK